MTTTAQPTLPRLITRRDVDALLSAFALPCALALPDGKLFARASTWLHDHIDLDERDAYRVYPLNANGVALGALAVAGDTTNAERALHQTLIVLLAQALEKREVANEALERYREINLMYRVSETIGLSHDADAIPRLVLEESKRVIHSSTGIVLIGEEVKASFGSDAQAVALRQAAREVIGTDHAAIISDTHVPEFGAILWTPLKTQERVLGGIVLGRGAGEPIFSASDEKLLMALAGQAAIALENVSLHHAELEKERFQRELQLAYDVQASLIPRETPIVPGWDFAAYWQPAREVSGDFYDFFPVPAGQSIVIADVSDKGMHAALFMALTRSTVRASTLAAESPADGLTRANRLLCADSTGGMFVTLFYAQLDPLKKEITYVNAGHNPPLVLRAATRELIELPRTGVMLGFNEGMEFAQANVALELGDMILFYTDGVTEANDASGEQFGEERLRAWMLEHADASPAALLDALKRALGEFIGSAAPFDDITVVIAKRVPVTHQRIAIPDATVECVPRLHEFVEAACAAADADDDLAFAFKLAVEEACTNIVEHGYRARPGMIELELDASATRIVVTITDHAPPFDPTQIPAPDLRADWQARKIGGLGWYLIRQLMDDVQYEPSTARGNVLTLVKQRRM
ncbi:MAG: SpoIIE family protein phosphatase [Chloroflexi bacterium]|nr:SpoIIE family protein phosphatase [Chloroflexota bacterium]